MQRIHDVTDFRRQLPREQGGNILHIFFDTEAEAQAYVSGVKMLNQPWFSEFPPAAYNGYRFWHEDVIAGSWIDDRRTRR